MLTYIDVFWNSFDRRLKCGRVSSNRAIARKKNRHFTNRVSLATVAFVRSEASRSRLAMSVGLHNVFKLLQVIDVGTGLTRRKC